MIVSYITMPDLSAVLGHAVNTGLIADDASLNILTMAHDRAQECIRKSEDEKAANLLRERCFHECHNLSHDTRSELARQRRSVQDLHKQRRAELLAAHGARVATIRSRHRFLVAELQKEIEGCRLCRHQCPDGSPERIDFERRENALADALRDAKASMSQEIAREQVAYCEALSVSTAEFKSRMDELDARINGAISARQMTVRLIAEAPADRLPAIYFELLGQEGGAR